MTELPALQIAVDGNFTMLHYIALVLAWLGGILVRFAHKVRIEGIDWRQYFLKYPVRTAASLIVSVAICLVMLINKDSNVVAYFSVAFMVETLVNKSEAQKYA